MALAFGSPFPLFPAGRTYRHTLSQTFQLDGVSGFWGYAPRRPPKIRGGRERGYKTKQVVLTTKAKLHLLLHIVENGSIMLSEVNAIFVDFSKPFSSVYLTSGTPNDFEKFVTQ